MYTRAMKKYNKFYFVHIQRTGGRYLFENVINHLYKSEQVELLNYTQRQGDLPHNGWVTGIDDDTYVMTVVREPLELISSYYCYFELTGDCVEEEDYDKEKLFKFIMKNPSIHNLQSKNLFLTSNKYSDLVLKTVLYQKVDFNLLEEKIKRLNMIFTLDYLKDASVEDIANKIASDMNIEPFFDSEFAPSFNHFSHLRAKGLYDSLTQDDKNNLTRYFEADYYLYNKIRAQEINS